MLEKLKINNYFVFLFEEVDKELTDKLAQFVLKLTDLKQFKQGTFHIVKLLIIFLKFVIVLLFIVYKGN